MLAEWKQIQLILQLVNSLQMTQAVDLQTPRHYQQKKTTNDLRTVIRIKNYLKVIPKKGQLKIVIQNQLVAM